MRPSIQMVRYATMAKFQLFRDKGGRMTSTQVSASLIFSIFLTGVAHANTAATQPTEFVGKDGAPMVLVPAGPFPMGVPPGARDGGRDEYPRHEVFLDAYYIDKFEVTNGRYLEFMKNTGHRPPKNPNDPRQDLWQAGPLLSPEGRGQGCSPLSPRGRG